MHSSQRPRKGSGGGKLESKVLGAIFDALDSLDSHQGPNLMHLLTLHVPPRACDSDPTPMLVPLQLMNLRH